VEQGDLEDVFLPIKLAQLGSGSRNRCCGRVLESCSLKLDLPGDVH